MQQQDLQQQQSIQQQLANDRACSKNIVQHQLGTMHKNNNAKTMSSTSNNPGRRRLPRRLLVKRPKV